MGRVWQKDHFNYSKAVQYLSVYIPSFSKSDGYA